MTSGQIKEELHRRDPDWNSDALGRDDELTQPTNQEIADALHRRDPAWWAMIQTARTDYAPYLEATGKAV